VVDRLADHCEVVPATSRDAHEWILGVFRDRVRTIEGARDAALCRDALGRIMRSRDGVCAVAVPRGYADDFAGWIVGIGGAAVYVYVRGGFRRQGIGTQLLRFLRAAGPVGVAYWTDDASEGAEHGLPIEHSIAAYAALLSFKRKGITG
jgi:GNAT superfamily N-acetyltransferase